MTAFEQQIMPSGAIMTLNGKEEYYPQSLVYFPDIVQILYEVQMWTSLSDEAKIMLDYCLYQTPKTKSGIRLGLAVRNVFNRKWGQTKTDRAFREVKRFLNDILN